MVENFLWKIADGAYNTLLNRAPYKWLEKRKNLDEVEGLWRIHDNLYDVSSFIDSHPGGEFWLEKTKGTDITEAFETHHVKSDVPEELLKNFFVKKASTPRKSVYTFEDSGFYKTLKKLARSKLMDLPSDTKISDVYTDILLISAFISACLSNVFSTYTFLSITGLLGSFLITASHNYTHRRDNFRMYYVNVFMMPVKTLHILSHHLFPNTTADMQLKYTLPLINVLPQKKSFFIKYFSSINTLFVFPFALHCATLVTILDSRAAKKFYKDLLLILALPFAMYYFGNQSLIYTLYMWQLIILITSLVFCMIAFTSNHVHPDLYMEGDALRSKDQLDWGISQLDTVCDRKEIVGNDFLTLVTFGDHALHHLFPTLDHGQLKHLYPIVSETLKRYNIKSVHFKPTKELFFGYFQQAARDVPNRTPPSL